MSYRSPHNGGLVRLFVLRCSTCAQLSDPPALDPNGCRDQAEQAGWSIDHNRPLEPRCPECRNSLLAG